MKLRYEAKLAKALPASGGKELSVLNALAKAIGKHDNWKPMGK